MDLKAFLKSLPGDAAQRFAQDCKTSLGHLRNICYGIKPCAPALAVLIEQKSGRLVTRQELVPDKWRDIWPELDQGAQAATTADQER